MSAFSRAKGARAEREVCALIRDLLGVDARRRVRNHGGDSDVLGVHGWALEVKHRATLDLPGWWRQTVAQADADVPCLWFKVPRRGWRVRWPLAVVLLEQRADMWSGLEWTCETTPQGWAAVVREAMATSPIEE